MRLDGPRGGRRDAEFDESRARKRKSLCAPKDAKMSEYSRDLVVDHEARRVRARERILKELRRSLRDGRSTHRLEGTGHEE